MGVFVNPSIESFEENLNADIFVDKSLLIKELNQIVCTTNKYLCVSRPRRFGKTMAENMLCAYYGRTTDTSHIFNDLKIGKDEQAREKYLKYLNAFNILKIDCQSVWTSRKEKPFMQAMNDFVNEELIAEFPEVSLSNDNSVATNILKIYNETKVKFVIFFDEYDMPVRYQLKESEFQEYLDFLVSLFKSSIMAPAVALGYMTGILPIIRDVRCYVDNFKSSSMVYPLKYGQFFEFTKQGELCDKSDIDFIVQQFKRFKADSIVPRLLNQEKIEITADNFLNNPHKILTIGHLLIYLIHLGLITFCVQDGWDFYWNCYMVDDEEVLKVWKKVREGLQK